MQKEKKQILSKNWSSVSLRLHLLPSDLHAGVTHLAPDWSEQQTRWNVTDKFQKSAIKWLECPVLRALKLMTH